MCTWSGIRCPSYKSLTEVHALLQAIITRLMRLLTRRGVLVEEMGQACLAEPDADGDGDGEDARTLRPLQAAAVTYRIAFGPRDGQKVLTLRGAMPRETAVRQPLCADVDGFGLHAAVRVEAHDRKRLEQLCRCITRPALCDERVQFNAAGQVELELETPWRDGTTHLVVSPLQVMQRLAALVPPRPRLHLNRFHGVLAPNAKLRALVVPQEPEVQEQAAEAAVASEGEAETVQDQSRPHRISRAGLLERDQTPGREDPAAPGFDPGVDLLRRGHPGCDESSARLTPRARSRRAARSRFRA